MAATFCTIWALGFPISKLIIAICPPETFLGIRFLCSGTILLCWAFWRGYLTAAVPWWSLVSLGLVNFGLSNGFAWGGMATVSAANRNDHPERLAGAGGIAGALALADRLSPLRAPGARAWPRRRRLRGAQS